MASSDERQQVRTTLSRAPVGGPPEVKSREPPAPVRADPSWPTYSHRRPAPATSDSAPRPLLHERTAAPRPPAPRASAARTAWLGPGLGIGRLGESARSGSPRRQPPNRRQQAALHRLGQQARAKRVAPVPWRGCVAPEHIRGRHGGGVQSMTWPPLCAAKASTTALSSAVASPVGRGGDRRHHHAAAARQSLRRRQVGTESRRAQIVRTQRNTITRGPRAAWLRARAARGARAAALGIDLPPRRRPRLRR